MASVSSMEAPRPFVPRGHRLSSRCSELVIEDRALVVTIVTPVDRWLLGSTRWRGSCEGPGREELVR